MKALSLPELEKEILALQELKTPALQKKWREVFSTEPPRRMRAGFLMRAISYRLQEQAFGGLKPDLQRTLQRHASALRKDQSKIGLGSGGRKSPPRQHLSPGMQLMREWNGTTELVDVVTDGFRWRSKSYRTLSAVAVAITGTKWSGPKFFGLTEPLPKVSMPRAATRSKPDMAEAFA